MLHCDISPDNVSADAGSGEGFIADLDLARALSNNSSTDIWTTIERPGPARTVSRWSIALAHLSDFPT